MILFILPVSNEESETLDGRNNRDRRRRGADDDDTVLDSQDISSVTSQDQGK